MDFNMQHLYEQLDRFHLLDVKNATHPSMFVEETHYDILILTLPSKEKELKIDAHAFVFDATTYYHFDRKANQFVDMTSIQNVYEFLNEKTDITMKLVASIHESIEWMEEQLYEKKPFTHFTRYWLGHKKDLSRIHRLLNLAEDALEHFLKSYMHEEDFLMTHFKDIEEHLQRTNRSVLLAMDKLGNLYSFYTTRNNERMNKTIYLLTILSGIFLPLHLIVGYFGINTQGLPLSTIENGSLWVIGLLLLGALGMIAGIWYYRKKYW